MFTGRIGRNAGRNKQQKAGAYKAAGMLCVLGTLFLLSAGAQAATSASVTINGRILSSTCAIDVNGSPSATVNLPDVKTSDFKDTTAGIQPTPFTINLANCADVNNSSLYISVTRAAAPAVGDTAGTFLATSGSAKDTVAFKTGLPASGAGPAWTFNGMVGMIKAPALVAGKTSLSYTIAYRALKLPVQAGTVSGTLKVDIAYK